MVKKNKKKIINNDDFLPLPPSPTMIKIFTPKSTGQETEIAWTIIRKKKESLFPLQNQEIQLPNQRHTIML